MIKVENIVKGFKTPESRWARFGPYYAMFPVDFAFEVVEKYSKTGDYIIDPFEYTVYQKFKTFIFVFSGHPQAL